jgi:hypothetical protein
MRLRPLIFIAAIPETLRSPDSEPLTGEDREPSAFHAWIARSTFDLDDTSQPNCGASLRPLFPQIRPHRTLYLFLTESGALSQQIIEMPLRNPLADGLRHGDGMW